MSDIFGDMDIDKIPDDPFFVASNTYWALVTDAKKVEKDGNTQIIIQWSIDEPASEYHGESRSQYFNLTPLTPGQEWEDLTSDEKKPYKFFKKLCRRGFDLSEEEIKQVNIKDLQGKQAFIKIVNTDGAGEYEGRVFSNIRDVISKRTYEEEHAEDSMTSDMGL